MASRVVVGSVVNNAEASLLGMNGLTLTAISDHLRDMAEDLKTLIPRTSESVACLCAEKLLRGGLMTSCLADAFLRRDDRSSTLVLFETSELAPETIETLAKTGSLMMARAIAGRSDLSDKAIYLLTDRNDAVIDQLLAEHTEVFLPEGAMKTLAQRALMDASLARRLLTRSGMPANIRAALFLHASPRQRMNILRTAEALAPSRPHIVDQSRIEAIQTAIDQGDANRLTAHLSEALSIPHATLYSILGETSGAMLALALMAVDTPEALVRQACRSVAAHNLGVPGGVEDVIETIRPASARWLMAAIAEAAASSAPLMAETLTLSEATERRIA